MARDRGCEVGYAGRIPTYRDIERLVQGAAVIIGVIGESNPRVKPEEFGWNRGRFVGVGIYHEYYVGAIERHGRINEWLICRFCHAWSGNCGLSGNSSTYQRMEGPHHL